MSKNEGVSYHIDAGGETELDPVEYKIAILQYRFGYDENELRQKGAEYINERYETLTKE